MAAALVAGAVLGAGAGLANSVPLMLGEVGEARADRSLWSQAAEFVSLILDSGWAWAATAVLAGWLAGDRRRPRTGAVAGFVALVVATGAYYATQQAFADGGDPWADTRFWWLRSLVLGLPLGAVGALARRTVLAWLVVPLGAVLNLEVLPLPAESRMAGPVYVTVWAGALVVAGLIVGRALRERPEAVESRHG